jgi:hypothetical protein
MKKIILPLLVCLTSFIAKAQPCVPGTVTVPKAGYVLPDSATNFAHACIGLPYEQIIYIKAPKDTTVGGQPANIDSFVVNKNVTGLPPGLTVEAVPGFTLASPPNPKTDFDRLIIKGDSLACIRISGTVPVGTTPGIFNLNIDVRAYVKVFGLLAVDTPSNLTYYKIDVKGTPCSPASVSDMAQFGFEVNDLVPNPAIDKAELLFTAAKHESFSIKVFNLLGQEMYSNTIQSIVGDNKVYLDASHWSSGTYIYSLSNGRNTHTGKLQVSR